MDEEQRYFILFVDKDEDSMTVSNITYTIFLEIENIRTDKRLKLPRLTLRRISMDELIKDPDAVVATRIGGNTTDGDTTRRVMFSIRLVEEQGDEVKLWLREWDPNGAISHYCNTYGHRDSMETIDDFVGPLLNDMCDYFPVYGETPRQEQQAEKKRNDVLHLSSSLLDAVWYAQSEGARGRMWIPLSVSLRRSFDCNQPKIIAKIEFDDSSFRFINIDALIKDVEYLMNRNVRGARRIRDDLDSFKNNTDEISFYGEYRMPTDI